MTRWLTSDLHLGHTNIIEYAERPYIDVEQMNNDLVSRWNEVVAPEDVVWVLGDVALGRLDDSLAYVSLMNGTKHLIPGNHDRMFGCQGTRYANAAKRYLDAGFVEVHNKLVSLVLLTDESDISLTVLGCHFPYVADDRHAERYADERPTDHGSYLVHGHTHGTWRKNGRMIDVGVDAWGGYPVSFETVAELFANGAEHEDPLSWA